MTVKTECGNCSRPLDDCPTCGNKQYCWWCKRCNLCGNPYTKRDIQRLGAVIDEIVKEKTTIR